MEKSKIELWREELKTVEDTLEELGGILSGARPLPEAYPDMAAAKKSYLIASIAKKELEIDLDLRELESLAGEWR